MASNVGVTTRQQTKKIREILDRHGSNCPKRKTSRGVLVHMDEENVDVVTSTVYNRRSFPLEHESDHKPRDVKKVSKTESSAKQRRVFGDRGENSGRYQPAVFKQHYVSQKYQTNSQAASPELICRHNVESRQKTSQSTYVYDDTVFETFAATIPLPDTPFEMRRVSDVMTPMETEVESSDILHIVVPQVPPDVVDIDTNPDSLTTTVYAVEIMGYLMWMETRSVLKPGFLDKSPDVTSRMRGVLMDWLLQVQNHEELKDETLHLCVSLIDRFLSLVDVKMPNLQLVGITCLLIASKFSERFAPEISTLCYLTDNTYEKDQVIQYERYILRTLHFAVTGPVCTTFLERYLQVHQSPPEIECLARYILDLSLTNVNMAPVLPSCKAAGALFLTRKLLHDCPPWTSDLTHYTGYTSDDLHDVSNELATLLIKAPDSKFQGARNKYNNEEYFYISHCDRIGPGWVLQRQFGRVIKSTC